MPRIAWARIDACEPRALAIGPRRLVCYEELDNPAQLADVGPETSIGREDEAVGVA
jgi:hypothetical protein